MPISVDPNVISVGRGGQVLISDPSLAEQVYQHAPVGGKPASINSTCNGINSLGCTNTSNCSSSSNTARCANNGLCNSPSPTPV